MGMDIIGASLTTNEVRTISETIKQVSANFEETMKNVSNIMTTLTGQSEGGIITQVTVAVEKLNELIAKLVDCIINIGLKIGDYVKAMLNWDGEAAIKIRESIESRVY